MKKINEPLLEPLLRRARLSRVLKYLSMYPNCELLDMGCGKSATLLRMVEAYISRGVGIDRHSTLGLTGKLTTFSWDLETKIPLNNSSFDLITMLAVMEHIENDKAILEECKRLLKPGGGLLITVPSWQAKPLLEFLSRSLGLVSTEEIDDHKRYYSKQELAELFCTMPEFINYEHSYFEWRFNNLVFCQVQK